MSKLIINEKFYQKLDNENNKKILKIHGYNSKEDFMQKVILKLNKEYNFLNITGYDFLNREEEKLYYEYNGYVKGEFKNFDLITVSFTTILGKSGNVFFSQQVVPMITAQLNNNINFLLDDRIKKICILTTHKSKKMSPSANTIGEDTTMQMSINFANTIGFEFIEMIPILGLNIQGRYKSVEEIINHSTFLRKRKKTNSQFEQIKIEDNYLLGRFENSPKGQEAKFFSLKIYAITFLNTEYNIILDEAVDQTEDITIQVLYDYIKHISSFEVKSIILDKKVTEFDDNVIESEEDIIINTEIPEYKLEPETTFDTKGRKIYITKRKYKEQVMIAHKYLCACNDDRHTYFISSATRKNYLEGHHMIPMENQHQYWNEKEINLDCSLNIIPLCPHCHGKIHKAIPAQKIEIISNIYNKYMSALIQIDRELTLEKFAALYNVYIY